MDYDFYYIPKMLDEAEKILFWSLDEIAIIALPVFIIGIGMGAFISSIFISACMLFLWKKFKGSEQNNLHYYALYYFYPTCLLGYKITPPSYIKNFIG